MRLVTLILPLLLAATVSTKRSRSHKQNTSISSKMASKGILRRILQTNSVYVDKTGLILQLIRSDGHRYFLSRPRKFGKSLLLDTVEEIFLGNRELFQGREIYLSDYDWRTYPVLNFDFSASDNKPVTGKKLQAKLQAEISRFEKAQNIPRKREQFENAQNLSGKGEQFQERLLNALQYAYDHGNGTRAVVLVDEYDFPIVNNDAAQTIADECRPILRNFFQALEGAQIQFMLLTGVSMTTLMSLWSEAKGVCDISMNPAYSTLLGYTENEYTSSFDTHIRKFVERKNRSETSITNEIRFLYNGYRFSPENNSVHNPFSLRKYLDEMEPKNHWIDLETPAFLINHIWKRHREAVSLLLRSTVDSIILRTEYDDFDKVPLITLLLRTGYLTIKEYHPDTDRCEIDFPNEEVRETFIKCLMGEFGAIGPESMMEQRATIRANLEEASIYNFVENLQIEFHRMLDILAKLGREDVFGFTLRVILSLCALKSAEVKDTPLPLGRNDFVATLPKVFYVFEVQLISGYNFTMKPAEALEYKRKYDKSGHDKMVTVHLSYNPRTCFIEEWRATVYKEGKQIDKFIPNAFRTISNETDDQDLSVWSSR